MMKMSLDFTEKEMEVKIEVLNIRLRYLIKQVERDKLFLHLLLMIYKEDNIIEQMKVER